MNLKNWAKLATASFCDGFIDGFPVGTPVGGGLAAADGQVYADLGKRHILIEACHLLAIPFFCGLADLRAFQKANPLVDVIRASVDNQTAQPKNT